MPHRRGRLLVSTAAGVLTLACAQHGESPRNTDTGRASAAGQQTEPPAAANSAAHDDAAADSTPKASASAYLDRHRYAAWRPAAIDDSTAAACAGHDNGASDGVEINALWGIARHRLLAAGPDERDSTNVNVSAEVVRVLSVEGDSATSDGNYAKADLVIVRPVIDTVWLAFHRTSDRWVQCGFVWRVEDEVMSPIALTGPPADTLTPRGMPISHWVPSRVSWSRVRALADSLSKP
jgi:hypothetical protein